MSFVISLAIGFVARVVARDGTKRRGLIVKKNLWKSNETQMSKVEKGNAFGRGS